MSAEGLWVTDWECVASPDILGAETGAECPGADESQGAATCTREGELAGAAAVKKHNQ